MAENRDLVAGLQNVFAQAAQGKRVRISKLGAPMLDVTLVAGYIEENAAMGIGPNPFRDGAFESDCPLGIVGHPGAVVGERWAGERAPETTRARQTANFIRSPQEQSRFYNCRQVNAYVASNIEEFAVNCVGGDGVESSVSERRKDRCGWRWDRARCRQG